MDIVHTTLTDSAVLIPRTLYILLWQIHQGQSHGHGAYYSDRFCSADPKDIVHIYSSSQISNANPETTYMVYWLNVEQLTLFENSSMADKDAQRRPFLTCWWRKLDTGSKSNRETWKKHGKESQACSTWWRCTKKLTACSSDIEIANNFLSSFICKVEQISL